MQTFTLVAVLKGHRGSVLGLTLSDDEQYLFSSSGDGTVRVRRLIFYMNGNSRLFFPNRYGIQRRSIVPISFNHVMMWVIFSLFVIQT